MQFVGRLCALARTKRDRNNVDTKSRCRTSICFGASLRCPSRSERSPRWRARQQRGKLFEGSEISYDALELWRVAGVQVDPLHDTCSRVTDRLLSRCDELACRADGAWNLPGFTGFQNGSLLRVEAQVGNEKSLEEALRKQAGPDKLRGCHRNGGEC